MFRLFSVIVRPY